VPIPRSADTAVNQDVRLSDLPGAYLDPCRYHRSCRILLDRSGHRVRAGRDAHLEPAAIVARVAPSNIAVVIERSNANAR